MAAKFGPNLRAELMVRAAQGRLDELDETWHGFATQPQMPPPFRARVALNLAAFASAHGRTTEAETETRRRTEWLLEQGNATEYLEAVSQAAWTDLSVRRRPDLAVARLDEALARTPLDEMEPLDRPYLELAELLARAGRPDRARALVDEMQKADAAVPRQRPYLRQVEGEIALAEGRPDEAIERFQGTFAQFCSICPLPGLALAYEAAGQPDSAVAAHRRYVETPFSDRFLPYTYRQGQLLGPEYERLAELYDEQGDLENAVRFYAAFVDLWEGADEELQPRVRAAQARLQQIVETRG
jgi:tetratricopeptide (TPR) repeat protein